MSPFSDERDGRFTFSDATLLAFVGVVAMTLAVVLVLGMLCFEHRIAATLTLL